MTIRALRHVQTADAKPCAWRFSGSLSWSNQLPSFAVARYMVLSGANEKWALFDAFAAMASHKQKRIAVVLSEWLAAQKAVALQVASNIWEYYGLRGLWCLPERSADVSMWSSEAWRSCLLHPKKAMRWLAKGCEIQNVLDRWCIGSVGDFVAWGALELTCRWCRIWLKCTGISLVSLYVTML